MSKGLSEKELEAQKKKAMEAQAKADNFRPQPTLKELAERVAKLEAALAELLLLPTASAERASEARLRAELAQTEAERKALQALKARRLEYVKRFADERLVIHPDLSVPATALLSTYRQWAAIAPDVDPAERTIQRKDLLQALPDVLPGAATAWGDCAGPLEDGWPPKGMLGVGIIPPGSTAKAVLRELDALAKEHEADEQLALARAREANPHALGADDFMARRRIAFARLAEMSNSSEAAR